VTAIILCPLLDKGPVQDRLRPIHRAWLPPMLFRYGHRLLYWNNPPCHAPTTRPVAPA